MSQAKLLYELLKDGRPHRTDEILRVVYGSEHQGIARIGARVADLKKGKWPGKKKLTIEGRKDTENPALYWYQLKPELSPRVQIINAIEPFRVPPPGRKAEAQAPLF
jgi:hypothetical protein